VSLARRERGPKQGEDGKPSAIDETLVEELKAASGSEDRMKALLSGLNAKQLRTIGEIVHLHFRSKSKVDEMKRELIKLFQHGDLWQRISNA